MSRLLCVCVSEREEGGGGEGNIGSYNLARQGISYSLSDNNHLKLAQTQNFFGPTPQGRQTTS